MYILFLILQVICAVGMILTILMQSGKSAGLSGSIGGGAEAIFGRKKGLDDLLHKLSIGLAAGFLIFTLVLAFLN